MNEQLLREQIIELTKLLELKDMRIKELEALRTIPHVVSAWNSNQYTDLKIVTSELDKTSCICCNNRGK